VNLRPAPAATPVDAFAFMRTCHRETAEMHDEYAELVACEALSEERLRLCMRICLSMRVLLELQAEIRSSSDQSAASIRADVAADEWGRELIRRLQDSDPDDDLYNEMVLVLREFCEQLASRQKRFLSEAMTNSECDLCALAARLVACKAQLLAKECRCPQAAR
jgi:hypothetical protein